jgi:hypothetical protein
MVHSRPASEGRSPAARAAPGKTRTSNNDDGDDTGVRVRQDGSGTGTLTITESNLKDGIDARNVDVTEN